MGQESEKVIEEFRGYELEYWPINTTYGYSLKLDGEPVESPDSQLPIPEPPQYLRELVDDIEKIHEMYSEDPEPKTREELEEELSHGEQAIQYATYGEHFLRYDWDDLVLELRE